ncbi:hypothetical protein AB0B12_34395 [Streptomyces sp. NPDC044780]
MAENENRNRLDAYPQARRELVWPDDAPAASSTDLVGSRPRMVG